MDQPAIPNSAFRLRWRRTWPDSTRPEAQDDFVGHDPDGRWLGQCSVYRWVQTAERSDQWHWVANSGVYIGGGFAATAREGALAAELAYFHRKARDAAMRVVRDTIAEAKLVPWEGDSQGLSIRWASGKQIAWPITGAVAWNRERIYVSPEDGRRLLALLREDWMWRRIASYVEKPGGRHGLSLPTVIFDWIDE